MYTTQAGDVMTKVAIAGVPFMIAVGGFVVTLEATAQETAEVEERVRAVEIRQAEDLSLKVMVAQNTEAIKKLTEIATKNSEQLATINAAIAAICSSTDARCP